MTDQPDLADLRVLGASTTEVWAGANDPVSRGLVAWAGRVFGDERLPAVRGARAACALVVAQYPDTNARRWYVDQILAAVDQWLADPTRENQEKTMKLLDPLRTCRSCRRATRLGPQRRDLARARDGRRAGRRELVRAR